MNLKAKLAQRLREEKQEVKNLRAAKATLKLHDLLETHGGEPPPCRETFEEMKKDAENRLGLIRAHIAELEEKLEERQNASKRL